LILLVHGMLYQDKSPYLENELPVRALSHPVFIAPQAKRGATKCTTRVQGPGKPVVSSDCLFSNLPPSPSVVRSKVRFASGVRKAGNSRSGPPFSASWPVEASDRAGGSVLTVADRYTTSALSTMRWDVSDGGGPASLCAPPPVDVKRRPLLFFSRFGLRPIFIIGPIGHPPGKKRQFLRPGVFSLRRFAPKRRDSLLFPNIAASPASPTMKGMLEEDPVSSDS